MNERKRKNIIIMALCACITLMGIGYALLSQTLTINTTATINSSWDIRITNVEVANTVGYATDTTEVDNIADDGHSATVTADLSAPGDTITYTVTVHNFGTIAGMYDVNTENLITPGVGQPSGIVTATTDVATSNSLKYLAPTTGEGTFNVTLKFEDIDELPTVKEYSFTIKPNFIQTSESNVAPGGNEENQENGGLTWYYSEASGMVISVNENNNITSVIMYEDGVGAYMVPPSMLESFNMKFVEYTSPSMITKNKTGLNPEIGDMILIAPDQPGQLQAVIKSDKLYFAFDPDASGETVELQKDSTFTLDKYGTPPTE